MPDGRWLSPAERLVWDQEIGGSNPPRPTSSRFGPPVGSPVGPAPSEVVIEGSRPGRARHRPHRAGVPPGGVRWWRTPPAVVAPPGRTRARPVPARAAGRRGPLGREAGDLSRPGPPGRILLSSSGVHRYLGETSADRWPACGRGDGHCDPGALDLERGDLSHAQWFLTLAVLRRRRGRILLLLVGLLAVAIAALA